MVVLGGCLGDESTPRVQGYWGRALEGHQIAVTEISRESASLGSQELPFESRFGVAFLQDLGLKVSISQASQPVGFWLDLTNENETAIRVLWPDSRYVDENGVPHELFAQPMNPLPSPEAMKEGTAPTEVRPGARINYVVAPIYKASVMRYDAYERGSHHAPLIPTDLTNRSRFPDEDSVKNYVADLARRRTAVSLILPIEMNGERHDYTFRFLVTEL
ncbi:MAG: hypothetical protein ACRD2J_06355 [Thermoanaerobaculia bacterium]